LFLSVDKFSEKFAGCQLVLLVDFFSGYNQVSLDKKSRDLTVFYILLGLLQQTTLLIGTTNSVVQFVQVVTKILEDFILYNCILFLDDIRVKGLTTIYNNTEVLPGVRQFVIEYIQVLNRILEYIEQTRYTISPKLQFCISRIIIVRFVYRAEGRSPETAKVIKILE
jgi:hypothetical protein